MSLYKVFKANKSSFLLLLLLIVVPVIVSSSLGIFAVRYEDYLMSLEIWQWILLYIVFSLTMALALTPTTFIALLSGYFLGWISVPFMAFSYLIASFVGYKLAVYFDKGKFLKTLKDVEGVDRIINNLKTSESKIIILSRLSPVLPFAMMNLLLSISGATLKKFLFAGFLGMMPRTLLFIWVGSKAKYFRELLEDPSKDIISEIVFFLLLFVSLFGLFYYFKKAVTKPSSKI